MNEEEWREVRRKEGPGESVRAFLSRNSRRGGSAYAIHPIRRMGWFSQFALRRGPGAVVA